MASGRPFFGGVGGLWIRCWRWGVERAGERFGTDGVGSLRRDGLCPSVFGRARFVDSVLAVWIGDAPRGDWGPTESGPSGGMGSARPFLGGRFVDSVLALGVEDALGEIGDRQSRVPPGGWTLPGPFVGGRGLWMGCWRWGLGTRRGEIWDRRSRVPPEGWALPVCFLRARGWGVFSTRGPVTFSKLGWRGEGGSGSAFGIHGRAVALWRWANGGFRSPWPGFRARAFRGFPNPSRC